MLSFTLAYCEILRLAKDKKIIGPYSVANINIIPRTFVLLHEVKTFGESTTVLRMQQLATSNRIGSD